MTSATAPLQPSARVRELSNQLVVLSARLVREVRRNTTDLPAASTRMLSLLDELGASTVTELAATDRCSQPTMTGIVKGLVQKGWAERTPHPQDARASLIALTGSGREALTDLRRRNAALVADRIERSGHGIEELATAVAVLTDALHPREEGQ